jgi:negative regulator of sigma E activity
MLSTRAMYLLTAMVLGLAAIEPSSADGKLSDTPELKLLPLASAQDYRSASRNSYRRASRHSQLNETQAACDALAKSLDYYRMAIAKDTDPSAREAAAVDGDGGDGMREIRARFGCTRTQLG